MSLCHQWTSSVSCSIIKIILNECFDMLWSAMMMGCTQTKVSIITSELYQIWDISEMCLMVALHTGDWPLWHRMTYTFVTRSDFTKIQNSKKARPNSKSYTIISACKEIMLCLRYWFNSSVSSQPAALNLMRISSPFPAYNGQIQCQFSEPNLS